MNRFVTSAILALIVTVPLALADCCAIPFNPLTEVYEPDQRAMIAYNGREEILLLCQDIKVSKPTKALQVLPLPSEPKVTKGNFDAFVKAAAMINAKLGRGAAPLTGAVASGGGGGGFAPPAGEVTFHDKIGSHDISVTHVLNLRGFVDWVEGYLRKSGVDNPTIPEPMKVVVGDYLRDRYQWFVFDVVDLSTEVKTKEAIQYRFATRFLYYPMRITRSEVGDTQVRLMILSPELVHLPNLGGDRFRVAHKPIRITPAEVRSLGNDEMTEISGGRDCWLRIWEVNGRLSAFTKDIVTSW